MQRLRLVVVLEANTFCKGLAHQYSMDRLEVALQRGGERALAPDGNTLSMADWPGGGAAGGLGAALKALFPQATMRPGIELVLDTADFNELIAVLCRPGYYGRRKIGRTDTSPGKTICWCPAAYTTRAIVTHEHLRWPVRSIPMRRLLQLRTRRGSIRPHLALLDIAGERRQTPWRVGPELLARNGDAGCATMKALPGLRPPLPKAEAGIVGDLAYRRSAAT